MTTKKLFSILISFQFLFVQMVWAVPQSQAYKDIARAFAQVGFKNGRPLDIKSLEKKLKSQPQMYERYRSFLDILKKQSSLSLEMLSFEKDGMLYPRIGIRLGVETIHMDFYGEPERFLKVGDVSFVESDFTDPDIFFQKLMANNKGLRKKLIQQALRTPLQMSPSLWAYLTPHDQVMFMINLRLVHDSATAVLDQYKVKERVTTGLEKLFFETAFADNEIAEGGACIIGGWESVYVRNRCSANTEDLKDRPAGMNLSCPDNGFPCRPTLFGMDGSQPHCISRTDRNVLNFATRECGRKAPIGTPEEQKRLFESLLKVRGITQASTFTQAQVRQLVEGYNSDIDKAIQICSSGTHLDPNQNSSPDSACGVLETRKVNLQTVLTVLNVQAEAQPAPVPGQAEPGVLGLCPGVPAGSPVAGPGAAPGTIGGIVGQVPPCRPLPAAVGQSPTAPEAAASATTNPPIASSTRSGSSSSSRGFFDRAWRWMGNNSGLLIGGLVLAGTAAAIYYIAKPKKVKSNPLTYISPVAPPNTGSAVTPPISTNNACCLINNVWVKDSNGCQGRLNVSQTSTNLSLCGGGGAVQKRATQPGLRKTPGRR